MRTVFIHPDLGIGGAERLALDIGLCLKDLGHSVNYITAHHDRNHSFKETNDGTLDVTVFGDWLPRAIFGKMYALCAYLRMIYATICLIFSGNASLSEPDIIFCDQISACIPFAKILYRLTGKKVPKIIFYCHFPDQLLTKRESFLKRVYRLPIDWLEETTTGQADLILVNSKFTREIFHRTFHRLSHIQPIVLYPICNFNSLDGPIDGDIGTPVSFTDPKNKETGDNQATAFSPDIIFLSINRYERKKNIHLAIDAFDCLKKKLTELTPESGGNRKKSIQLMIAGGYDLLVNENRDYFNELVDHCLQLNLTENDVKFFRSPSDQQKRSLLHSCTALLYTPENEHFGIVPLEAGYMRRPVIACDSGGPLETIVNNETGFLVNQDRNQFADAMLKFVLDKSLAREMGVNAYEHVKKNFSYKKFKLSLQSILEQI